MKTRASVALPPGPPFEIVGLDLDGPTARELLVDQGAVDNFRPDQLKPGQLALAWHSERLKA